MKTLTEKQNIKVPIEVFLDVCKMIRTGNINNKITGSNETTGEVFLELSISKGNKIQNSALQNIYDIINEWNEQRYGDDNPDELGLN
jgi:hypothetical protein